MPIPAEVLTRIGATVSELADTPEVEGFLIASAPDPTGESAGLGADAVVDVFRSDDREEVREVYADLIRRFAAHPKHRPLDIDTTQPVGHVYVALWAVADLAEP